MRSNLNKFLVLFSKDFARSLSFYYFYLDFLTETPSPTSTDSPDPTVNPEILPNLRPTKDIEDEERFKNVKGTECKLP